MPTVARRAPSVGCSSPVRLILIFGFLFALTVSLWSNRWTPVVSFLGLAIFLVFLEAIVNR
jgi:hypothetical protein